MEVILKANNLFKKFGKKEAVADLSLELRRGEILGLLGPDGAGKTTTIRLFASVYTPTGGSLQAFGSDIANEKQANLIRQKIGYVSQQFSLYPDLTVEENMDFFADIYGITHDKKEQRKSELLAFTKLDLYVKRPAQKLSGGMKQKLSLACALVHDPEILLLDEPTTGVDPVSRREFWRILYNLIPNVTILVSTPYMDEAERCSRLVLMHEGKEIVTNTPENVKALIKKMVLEITCDNSRRALGLLSNIHNIESIELFGDKLHILLADIKEKEPIIRMITQKGIRIFETREVVPSLEDVFIYLLKERTNGRNIN